MIVREWATLMAQWVLRRRTARGQGRREALDLFSRSQVMTRIIGAVSAIPTGLGRRHLLPAEDHQSGEGGHLNLLRAARIATVRLLLPKQIRPK